jgi:hypothetical protein
MQDYVLVTRNTPDVAAVMSGYTNTVLIGTDSGRAIYKWSNITSTDTNNLDHLRDQNILFGLLALPAPDTL